MTPRCDMVTAFQPYSDDYSSLLTLARQLERELAAQTERAEKAEFHCALNEKALAAKEREVAATRILLDTMKECADKAERELQQARGEARWIPVGERLPEIGIVLAYAEDGETELYQWNLIKRYADDPDPRARITHWMPLPAAPSPASGEQINAAEQSVVHTSPNQERQQVQPALAAPNTAPQDRMGELPRNALGNLSASNASSDNLPAAAVPDDPVAVYWKLQTDADFMSGDEAIHALAAHYLHRAPEGYALVPLDRITSVTRAFDYLGNNINEPWVKVCFKHDDWSGRDSFANALATTKQEADR